MLIMKKILLFTLLAMGGSMNAQSTIFEDSFDTYTDFIITGIGPWTMTDVDLRPTYGFTGITFANTQVAKAFQVFNAGATSPPLTASETSDWTARTGDKALVCFAAVPNVSAPQNDDWMISPQMTLGSAGNLLSFWAKSCDSQYGDETFEVLVSTTGTAVEDFAVVSSELTPNDITYYEYTYDLDAYASTPVYIAIHCTSSDQFGFMVDDFKVTTTDLGRPDFFTTNFAAYPNPAKNVLNLNSTTGVQIDQVQLADLNGRIVRNIETGSVTETQINMGDLASGVYFLKVQSSAGTGVKKIMKN
jgi:hypothetical protein